MGEERPAVWVGHVTLPVTDLARSTAFWTGLGMRAVEQNPTGHRAGAPGRNPPRALSGRRSRPSRAAEVGFDLMVEDLAATHAAWTAAGLAPSTISHGHIHDWFTVADPDGWVLTVNSSHVDRRRVGSHAHSCDHAIARSTSSSEVSPASARFSAALRIVSMPSATASRLQLRRAGADPARAAASAR